MERFRSIYSKINPQNERESNVKDLSKQKSTLASVLEKIAKEKEKKDSLKSTAEKTEKTEKTIEFSNSMKEIKVRIPLSDPRLFAHSIKNSFSTSRPNSSLNAFSKVKAKIVNKSQVNTNNGEIKISLIQKSKTPNLSQERLISPHFSPLASKSPSRSNLKCIDIVPIYLVSKRNGDKDLIFEEILGKGSFSTVWSCRLIEDSEKKVAVKIYEKGNLSKNQREALKREISILKMLKHKHIILCLEVCENSDRVFLIFENFSGTTMAKRLKENLKFSEKECKIIFREISSAIVYLHSLSIAHRDLKLENILISENLDLKLIDFGFAIQLADSAKIASFCGSLFYMSPELVSGKSNNPEASDLWALGVIFYRLLTGKFPFRMSDNRNEILKRIISCEFEFPPFVSNSNKFLIRKLLNKSPASRMASLPLLYAL